MAKKEQELVSLLLTKTQEKNLRWEPTGIDEQFAATLNDTASFVVEMVRQGPRLMMMDDSNRLLVSVTGDADSRIADLFGTVKRQALDIDATLDKALDELKVLVYREPEPETGPAPAGGGQGQPSG